MAVGSNELTPLLAIKGVELGIASAGIKTPGRKDLLLIQVAPKTRVAAVFTQNQFCAAPVQVAKEHLGEADAIRYLLINSGNANAGTGQPGWQNALKSCEAVGQLTNVNVNQVLPFSTGVIGVPLPLDKLTAALPQAIQNLDQNNWLAAANAIMTTDTRPKGISVVSHIQGQPITITGIAKGSGMIKPNMATMLAYVATDADVSQVLLQSLLQQSVEKSFNRISVDGDTSTNDACVLMATGQSAVTITSDTMDDLQAFQQALDHVLLHLAQAIVKDGEGATKFVEICIEKATSSEEALDVAYSIAHSPLVKTALFASDPNWGRILACVGRAGVKALDVNKVSIWLGDVAIVEQGELAVSYTEEKGQAVMNDENIVIRVDLNRGEISETVWTTDLSHDYVTINAEYRT